MDIYRIAKKYFFLLNEKSLNYKNSDATKTSDNERERETISSGFETEGVSIIQKSRPFYVVQEKNNGTYNIDTLLILFNLILGLNLN